jgi:hypothetical protein
MRRFRKKGILRGFDLDELSRIAGDDWATVWKKLDISPRLSGDSMIGELRIEGKAALPIAARLGYRTKIDVVRDLCDSVGLSELESLGFLKCDLDREQVIARVEEMLVSYYDDRGDESLL